MSNFSATCDRQALLKAVNHIYRCPRQDGREKTRSVLVTVREDTIELSVLFHPNKGRMALRIAATETIPGTATIDTAVLRQFIRHATDTKVAITKIGDEKTPKVRITCGTTRLSINGMVSTIDERPVVEYGTPTPLPETLAKSWPMLRCCTAQDDSRDVLYALHISVSDGRATMETCDGFRLAQLIAHTAVPNMEAVIPLPMMRLLPAGVPIAIAEDQKARHIRCSWDGGEIDIEVASPSTFPDLNRVLEASRGTGMISGDRKSLLEQIESVISIALPDGQQSIGIILHAGQVQIAAKSMVGVATALYEGESRGEGDVSMNPTFLCDILRSVNAKKVSLRLSFVIKSEGSNVIDFSDDTGNEKYPTYAVMGMNIQSTLFSAEDREALGL